ncbi:hypothetical protein [Longispora fulva]|uniref:Uncharacterized protein n=1 Tax=Longispora fulva TaxID=619741 RepID=A0A8J7GEI2_9ACTN|nr:hypothetical protein [Longispora fulva]MBG6137244.1 hypothetical protein [Longispora fulva]
MASGVTTQCSPPPPPATGPGLADDYQFSTGFSTVQGGVWSYQQWDGTTYTDMTWDPAQNAWRGACEHCLIARDWMHPDVNDAVVAWKAPRTGDVVIRGTMDHHGDGNRAGDGVRTVIRQRHGGTVAKIWPSADYQVIRPNFTAQHIVQAHVEVGDVVYFHLNRSATTASDTTSWDPRISYDYQPKFTLDEAELVMDPADFDRAGIGVALDASLSTVSDGTNIDFYHSNSDAVQKFRGTLERPAGTGLTSRFTNPRNLDGDWWIENIYRTPTGRLLAFCHIENATTLSTTGWWAAGLAYSTDGGATFQKLGKTISTTVRDDTAPFDGNIGGVPYVVRDGYFYAYYGDPRPAVARAPVADVLAAAERGTVTPWRKFHDGGWEQKALGDLAGPAGRATTVIPQDAVDYYMTHGDAAYSTYLGKYLLAGYSGGAGKGTYLTFSDDGTSFEVPSWTQKSDNPAKDSLSPYETIVNADGTDNGVVGQSFYVYYGYRGKMANVVNSQYPQEWRWLYRQRVTLHRAGFDRPAANASTAFTAQQGGNDWRYLEHNGTTYVAMTWDGAQHRWNGSSPNLSITSTVQHPDGQKDAVRAWVAPRAGTVRITVGMNGVTVGGGVNADGVKIKIMKSGSALWPASGYQPLSPGTFFVPPVITTKVAQGEVLYFHVNQNLGTAFDSVTWVPVVSYVRS